MSKERRGTLYLTGALTAGNSSRELHMDSFIGGTVFVLVGTQPGTLHIEATPTRLPWGNLAANVLAGATTIYVVGGEGFPAGAGSFSIGGDAISYTGHVAGSQTFTGCSGALAHKKGAVVNSVTPDNRVWHEFDAKVYAATGLFVYRYAMLPGRIRFTAESNNYTNLVVEPHREVA